MLLEHRDHLQAFRRRLQLLARPLDVLPADQDLDRLRSGRRRAEAAFLHRLAQLLVVDPFPSGLHRGEQCRLGVARWRFRLLVFELGLVAPDGLALLELRQLSALVGVVVALARLLVGLGFEPVDTARASRQWASGTEPCRRRDSARTYAGR